MLKTKTKYLIVFLGILIAMCLFNTNSVQAVEDTQTILNMIPNEIQLDIPESDYQKATEVLKEYINNLLKNNNINTNVDSINGCMPWTKESFYSAQVYINGGTKEVKIQYNNTNNKNSNDEQIIKNIKIDKPLFHEVDLDYLVNKENIWEWYLQYAKEYYSKIINDNTIKVTTILGAGSIEGLNLGACHGGLYVCLWKDNLLYDIRNIGDEIFIPVINISSNGDFKENVINEIKKYYPDYAGLISNVEKGITDENMVNTDAYKEIENLYTIKLSTTKEPNSLVIIRKTDSSLKIVDETTNIKMDTNIAVVPENTKLVVTEITEGKTYNTVKSSLENVNKFKVFDITLLSDNIKIQPNGNVKISIPIPDNFNTSNLVVYRVTDNGDKTKYNVKIETIDNVKYATFETDHFSTYVLTDESTNNEVIDVNTQGEKDNTPKTGIEYTSLSIIAIITILGTIVLIKKMK